MLPLKVGVLLRVISSFFLSFPVVGIASMGLLYVIDLLCIKPDASVLLMLPQYFLHSNPVNWASL